MMLSLVAFSMNSVIPRSNGLVPRKKNVIRESLPFHASSFKSPKAAAEWREAYRVLCAVPAKNLPDSLSATGEETCQSDFNEEKKMEELNINAT